MPRIGALVPLLDRSCLIVGKCTVPVGTASHLSEQLRLPAVGTELAWCPEFLYEGHAVQDTLTPDRVVVGVQSARAEAILRDIHAEQIVVSTPFLVTDLATAELVKVAANAFLATKISFISAIAEVCEAAHGDVHLLAEALDYDSRIGLAGLRPGLGFGGGCLPKDIRAFMARADEPRVDQALSFLREVDAINMRRRAHMVDLVRELAGGMDGAGGFDGVRVGVLGVAFKPNSDDIRDSPALDVARTVHDLGAVVTVYDPVAMSAARRAHPELRYADSAVGAAQDAEVMLLLTEWNEFCEADPEILARSSTSATSSTVATQSTQTAGGKSPGTTAPSAARRQLWRYFAGRNIATSTGRHRHANGRPCTRSATRTSKPTPRRTSRCPVQTEVQPVYLIVESRLVDPASAFSSGVWQSGQSVPTRAPPRKT